MFFLTVLTVKSVCHAVHHKRINSSTSLESIWSKEWLE